MSATLRWLTREGLDRLLDHLARETELIAPVDVEGETMFLPVRGAAEICRDYVNSLAPPKDYLLPARERLLAYRIERGVPSLLNGDGAPRPRVIFGIRSCDVAGAAYLEHYLSGEMFGRPDTADGPFLARREATTLLSVVCRTPGATCMCVCCQGGPALEQYYDWQLTELADGWLVEVGSDRGRRLAERYAQLLGEPPEGAAAEKDALVHDTIQRFGEYSMHRVPSMASARMVSTGRLDETFWRKVGERCVECGGCAYVCPTCWCFNVVDVTARGAAGFDDPAEDLSPAVPGGVTGSVPDGEWERVRMRDCCQQAGFIRQAGGGYPRWTCGERCLTRFFHKLSQQFQARTGASGCTGCGRCIQVCMGEEGIDRVAENMRDALVGPLRERTVHGPLQLGAGPQVVVATAGRSAAKPAPGGRQA